MRLHAVLYLVLISALSTEESSCLDTLQLLATSDSDLLSPLTWEPCFTLSFYMLNFERLHSYLYTHIDKHIHVQYGDYFCEEKFRQS